MMHFVVALLIFTTVVSCAPSTIQGLREKHEGLISLITDEDYQAVYRKCLTQAKNCNWAPINIEGDIFTDVKTGNISVVNHWGLGIDYLMMIDISAVTISKTHVDIYYAVSHWRPLASAVEHWLKENSTSCKVYVDGQN